MILAIVLWACGDKGVDSADPVCADAPVITWESQAKGLLDQWCQPCHASTAANRHGAPESVTFDTEEQAIALGARIVAVTTPPDATMPPGMDLPEEDAETLRLWVECSDP